ncbi:MAG: gamma-glutamyl-gamma-aminobutyrate hydrolase family protein [Acidobacteria bacterium]|nr:gamma-glutamyl-gamma-aminobutyrate hydrolase family protein [Acidobacteriota bacterium]
MPTIALSPCRQMSDYLESVRRAGATPLELTLADDPAAIAARVDGLMLTGGGDVDPALYGATPHATFGAAEPGRDAFEIALVRAVLDAGKPVFAICRGMQVLNVALGGDLVQDIPTEVNGAAHHDVREPRYALAHEVWTTQGSRFSTLMREKLVDGESCQVNSRHHQAVKHLGAGLEVVATAPDGVIEAVERPGAFCLGVQWHPENFWRTGEFRPLFEGFVDACRRPS